MSSHKIDEQIEEVKIKINNPETPSYKRESYTAQLATLQRAKGALEGGTTNTGSGTTTTTTALSFISPVRKLSITTDAATALPNIPASAKYVVLRFEISAEDSRRVARLAQGEQTLSQSEGIPVRNGESLSYDTRAEVTGLKIRKLDEINSLIVWVTYYG
jgi:hypothetical protein